MTQRLWLAAIGLVMACNAPEPQAAIATPATDRPIPITTKLPQLLEAHLETNGSPWHIVKQTDYSKTWYSFYDSSYNACWARTDINDDQQADYAILLKKQNRLQLVIYVAGSSHAYMPYTVYETAIPSTDRQPAVTTGVAVASPGQIDVVSPRIQSLVLKSNGFTLLELEERTRIFYWQRNSIQTFYLK